MNMRREIDEGPGEYTLSDGTRCRAMPLEDLPKSAWRACERFVRGLTGRYDKQPRFWQLPDEEPEDKYKCCNGGAIRWHTKTSPWQWVLVPVEFLTSDSNEWGEMAP